MGRLVKCPYCEEKVEKDESVEYKKRYYHQECFTQWQQEKQHREELIQYICELYKIDIPTGMMLKQIKDFQTDYKYKLKGIELALRYFHETLDNPIREGQGIGIVPYVYEAAKKHYIMKLNVEKSVQEHQDKQMKNKVISIDSPEITYKKKTREIDISSL